MGTDQLLLRAPAKINLFLKVTGCRADGYHTLETRMQKLRLGDELELRLSDEPGVRLDCPGASLPEDAGNIVYRAARLFLRSLPPEVERPGVRLTLHKKIPVAAGLGGGSSDAAACLKGLNLLFSQRYSDAELAAMGLRLGADVPFFLNAAPAALATGVGERLQPAAPLPPSCTVLLVNPGIPVSTAWVYQTFTLTEGKRSRILNSSQNDLYEEAVRCGCSGNPAWSAALCNDLEEVTIARHGELARIKEDLLRGGAFGVLMSGSGATVFGLFTNKEEAGTCAALFRSRSAWACLTAPLTEAA